MILYTIPLPEDSPIGRSDRAVVDFDGKPANRHVLVGETLLICESSNGSSGYADIVSEPLQLRGARQSLWTLSELQYPTLGDSVASRDASSGVGYSCRRCWLGMVSCRTAP